MHVQKWIKRTDDEAETITCVLKIAKVKCGDKFRIIEAVHRAKSSLHGSMDISSPMIRDIQDAIQSQLRTSRDFGFEREK
jgi:hypothetical protein